jgi:hypothetical protein
MGIIEFDRSDLKRQYESLPKSIAPHVTMELLGISNGVVTPQVADGELGLHRVAISRDDELVLGLDRRRRGPIRVIMIAVRKRQSS